MKPVILYFYLPLNYFLFYFSNVKFSSFKVFGLLIIMNKGFCHLGTNIRINSSKWANIIGGSTRTSIIVRKNASLIIGDNVSISNSSIYCTNKIIIGDYVMIGGSCKIWDSDFHPLNPIERKSNPNTNFISKPIFIGDSVFIGGGSIILKGVTIGENSIIGAGSVVSKDIPSNEIWAGNPAKFIRSL